MPLPTIDLAFVKQYEAEVHAAYQRQGSKLRGTIRTKNGVRGASTIFQKVGKGSATQKARHGIIPAMNLDHSTVECTLADWYAGEWIDKLDELKINHDERTVVVNSEAWALGRKTDEMIITALDSVGSGQNVTGSSDLADSAGLTKAKVLMAIQMLNEADVPDDGQRFAVVSPGGWTGLMSIAEFASADFIGADLPYRQSMGTMARSWLGVNWLMHSGLPMDTTYRENFIYHRTAVGHAIGAEVTTDITWHGDRAAHFVNNMMSQGAVLIDGTGVVRIKITEP
ncbi:hypothetical protein GXW74_19820 [Roseomonas eburnea]|uniref:Uncharacterized protein n=1 Tax=Neoroseomonas eburnea TaxID=1346889 RepID=A0A9X9XGB4_9PROT|nr:hypothetical protein [Neoroseomonas eburnea]